ncbi:putative ankyrin repeat-containing domain-containing protein [Plasmopara halstedii]
MSEELQEAVDGLFLAAEYGRSDVIKALTEHGHGRLSLADVVDPVTGRSPLHVAVASGKKDALRVLLAAGFPPEHQSKKIEGKDEDNRSAYALAQKLKAEDLLVVFHQFLIQQVAANDVKSVNQLLLAGVDIGVTDAATGGSLLHWAASCHAVDVMRFLLERKDVKHRKLINARNGDGATPLHLACHANDVECTSMLLLSHANVFLKGDKGVSKDKTALELATMQEVKDVFLRESEQMNGSKKTEVLMQKEIQVNEKAENEERVSCKVAVGDTEERETLLRDQNSKLRLQLEEKDLLVNQLKKTIDAMAQDLQEAQMLGEERVMLDYVRKLRDEKMVVQRQLEDAMDYIKDQSQQLESLKTQIREMSLISKQNKTNNVLSRVSDGTTSYVVGRPPESTHSSTSVSNKHDLEDLMAQKDHCIQAQPLQLDAWTSRALREKEAINRYAGKHGPDIWSTVWNGIWIGRDENETRDEDGEVIMTV